MDINTTTICVTLPDQILRDLMGIAIDEGLSLDQTLGALVSGYKKSSQDKPMINVVPLRQVIELTPTISYTVNGVLHSIMNPSGAKTATIPTDELIRQSGGNDPDRGLNIKWLHQDGTGDFINQDDHYEDTFITIMDGSEYWIRWN